jgi:hypothetical protein
MENLDLLSTSKLKINYVGTPIYMAPEMASDEWF